MQFPLMEDLFELNLGDYLHPIQHFDSDHFPSLKKLTVTAGLISLFPSQVKEDIVDLGLFAEEDADERITFISFPNVETLRLDCYSRLLPISIKFPRVRLLEVSGRHDDDEEWEALTDDQPRIPEAEPFAVPKLCQPPREERLSFEDLKHELTPLSSYNSIIYLNILNSFQSLRTWPLSITRWKPWKLSFT